MTQVTVMLYWFLQSCTYSLQVLPGSSSEMFPTPSHGTCAVSNTAVQQDAVVIEERSMAVNKEVPTGIKQEEIPENVSFPNIKAEPHEVSYVCVCMSVITHIVPVSGNVGCFYANISRQLIQLRGWERKYILFSV